MAITEEQRKRSARLHELIDKFYASSGRFSALEAASGISASRWKNFYYGKQQAADDMVYFWCKTYPSQERYLMTGVRRPPDADGFATHVAVRSDGQTIGDRLVWVISEWAGGSGAQLFQYLETKSDKKIPADDWAAVIMRTREPTLQMVQVVCKQRPHFAQWVINGSVSSVPSVDPTSPAAVSKWHAAVREMFTPKVPEEPSEEA